MATIGVLGLQGDVREHLAQLTDLGARAVSVRRPADLAGLDGLILPGGESTTQAKLARIFGLLEPLREAIAGGLPTFGTCAGMIMLANEVLDGADGQETLGGMDITVRRNAFGRQTESFEGAVDFAGIAGSVPAVFIRAPWVERVGAGVEVLARVESAPLQSEADGEAGPTADGRIVAVRQGHMLATSFHPEIEADTRVHHYFLSMIG